MIFNELENLTYEELVERFDLNMRKLKYGHDMAVLCGSLGMSQKKYKSLMQTLGNIDNHNEQLN